jgi:hypothetical protein
MTITLLLCTPLFALDKFATYGALSVFGSHQATTSCFSNDSTASAQLVIAGRRDIGPKLQSILDGVNSLKFTFTVENLGAFSSAPPLQPVALEAWRTYLSMPSGVWDVVSVQKLASGERLSDAIRFAVPGSGCVQLSHVGVTEGDMQVATVGQAFALPMIRAEVIASTGVPARNASVALASEVIANELLDTGIDGPKTALLTDAGGHVDLTLAPGIRSGIKRFIVKARHQGDVNAVSAMVTLAHAPAGAPVVNSVPVVEYAYSSGADSLPRYLAASAPVVRTLDAYEGASVVRTGQVWRAFKTPDAAPGASPVCQFFGRASATSGYTHFFTANAQECAALRDVWANAATSGVGLVYEGTAFYAVAPDGQGTCPSAFPIPIVRYFHSAPAPHHLYLVADVQTREPVVSPPSSARRDGVAFCTDVAAAS